MTRYKCLIADDDLMDRDLIALYLGKIPQVEVVAICTNGLEALQALAKEEIDIMFSDVEMPDLSGLNLLKTLKKMPVTVLVSAHSEYAAESYNLDVIDFIVKPVTLERLLKAVNKAVEYIELKKTATLAVTPEMLPPQDNFFYIRESNDLVKLNYDDVAYIESMGNFSKIYTTNQKRHITLVSLKNLEAQLPAAFFSRIHKQYIINHRHIAAISAEEVRIYPDFLLPVGHLFRQELLDKVVSRNIITRNIGK
ncbi:LytR/AlgR family response regulator transcription factor [Chitinophagaceae bacterium MMS25-I14]